MKILRIKAQSVHDALADARRRLGDDVTVLHTRQLEVPALFGLRRKPGVEILAAVDAIPGPQTSAPVAVSESSAQAGDAGSVARDIAEIRQIAAKMDANLASDGLQECSAAAERLIRNGVPEKIAELLTSGGEEDVDRILDLLTRRITCSGALKVGKNQSRVALVGPTGVGKTTTIAKLAAQYSLVQKRKVGLLTLDTYRIGAVEQLSTYARLLDIPLEVALSPEDVDSLVARHRDKDLILIDTVGRSQRSREQLSELAKFLEAANPTEVHLTVSASASPAAQREAVDGFGSMCAAHLILTKLDECPQPGCIVELASMTLLPFSYVTCGQDVPDDIYVADSEQLARVVWEGVR